MSEQSVYIIDDDPAVRDALFTLIDSVGHKAVCYADADSFLDAYQGQAGCLISDICLPGTDGMALLKILNQREIRLPLIAISAHGDIPMAVSMLRHGAIDFIEKPFRNHLLLRRVQEALDWDRKQRHQAQRADGIHTRMASLTPREKDLLPLLMEGLSSKRIARELNLSPRTVETHRANLLRKMQVDSVTALTRLLLSVSQQ